MNKLFQFNALVIMANSIEFRKGVIFNEVKIKSHEG